MTCKLHVDFECYAPVSLDDTGAPVFTSHPEFAITTFAWAFDDGPVQSRAWPLTRTLPTEITAHIAAGGVVCAHNAPFEHAVLTNNYKLQVKPEQLDCSMARACAYGLPAGLGPAGRALNLATVKDESGRANMLAMAKPPKKGKPLHEVDPIRLADLEAYCRQDVEAERALSKALPQLSEFERRVSVLTDRSNMTGFMVDIPTIQVLKAIALKVETDLNAQASVLTGGDVTNVGTQTQRIKKWLAGKGLDLPSIAKGEVAAELGGAPSPEVRALLELRALTAKSSLAKLGTMLDVAGPDSRVRDQFQYYGAGRTGRWAGRGSQPQNLPKPARGVNVEATIKIVGMEGEVPGLLYESPLGAISACLRGCIIAKPGHVLLSLDLAQIEARVVAWLAGQDDVLELFRRGEDVYTYAGQRVGGDRALGKELTLACGYGMGGPRFLERVRANGLSLTLEQATAAVTAWRLQNSKIKDFWDAMTIAPLASIGIAPPSYKPTFGKTGDVQRVGKLVMGRKGPTFAIKKPNGGYLYYHNPRTAQGRFGPEFAFDGPGKGGQWQPLSAYGAKLVENVAQAVARDVMADAVVRIEEKLGLVPVITVHDEAVYEVPADQALHAEIKALFEEVPDWAPDLPIASDTRCSHRYGK